MSRVLACIQWDEVAQTCQQQAWIDLPNTIESLMKMLPTVDQAQTVGAVYFGTIVLMAALGAILHPRNMK